MPSRARFQWDAPLLLDQQLTEEERQVRDAARAHCQDRLAPRVLEAFGHALILGRAMTGIAAF